MSQAPFLATFGENDDKKMQVWRLWEPCLDVEFHFNEVGMNENHRVHRGDGKNVQEAGGNCTLVR